MKVLNTDYETLSTISLSESLPAYLFWQAASLSEAIELVNKNRFVYIYADLKVLSSEFFSFSKTIGVMKVWKWNCYIYHFGSSGKDLPA
jgi:hypothetical protein